MNFLISSQNIKGIEYLKIKGEKKGDILIFLPGLGVYKENYISHLENFKPEYESIYCIDLPEQGSKYQWRIGNMVLSIQEFIQHKDNSKINNIHLAGHSAGAIAILSFLINYTKEVEDELIHNGSTVKSLSSDIFPKIVPETQKVNKLILYSPVDKFSIVFPNEISQILIHWKCKILKNVLNILVNYPLFLIGKITPNRKFKFSVNPNLGVQYFKLFLTNHVSFFDYVIKYKTPFELYQEKNSSINNKIDGILKGKEIIVVYGSIDWLLKPFGKRKNKIDDILSMNNSLKVKRFNRLGHLLKRKNRLDFNMNSQMILNKDVIQFVKAN